MEGCVIVKKKEYDALTNAKEVFDQKLIELEKQHKLEVLELKKLTTPDYIHIIIDYDKYNNINYHTPLLYKTTLNLSSGLYFQIRRILAVHSNQINKYYSDIQRRNNLTIDKLNKEKDELYLELSKAKNKLKSFGFSQAFKKFFNND